MCSLLLTSEAFCAVESRGRLSSFSRLSNVHVFKFRAAWIRFCSWFALKGWYSPSYCVWLKLIITSKASRVVNSCSLMGIILFLYFNSNKGVKKTMASGNSRTRSSISPVWFDCCIWVYLNFALRKHEKLNKLLPQFFCVYVSGHLTDTYSSFSVIAGGEIFFSHSHVLLVFFFCNRLRVFNDVTDAVKFIHQNSR